jgi:hypothetical protein
MKRSAVVILSVLFSLSTISCMKHSVPDAKQISMTCGKENFLVRIADNGNVVGAEYCGGSSFEQEQQIKGAIIVFYTKNKGYDSFLKKEEGIWKKVSLTDTKENKDGAKGEVASIIAEVCPRGDIIRVTNLDGKAPDFSEDIDIRNAQLMSFPSAPTDMQLMRSTSCKGCWTSSGCACYYCRPPICH